MAKLTLLEMVQSIMSDMSSDAVTSINDTDEALQVASIIHDVYDQLVTGQNIPEHKALAQLTNAGSTAKVFMKIPDSVYRVETFKYNKIADGDTDAAWGEVCYLSPESFMNILTRRTTTDSNVVSATDPTSSIALDMILNDQAPTYWTTFDDHYIVCDAYDAVVDTTGLLASKTLCWAVVKPTDWTVSDSFVPDIDATFFPLLLAEAKSTAFINLKQQANPKIDKQARNQKVVLQNEKHRTRASEKTYTNATGPSYGRRR